MLEFKLSDPNFLAHVGCEIDLQVNKGEALVIFGENGVGKTTLLRKIHSHFDFDHGFVEQSSLDFFYDRRLTNIKNILVNSLSNLNFQKFQELWRDFQLDKKEDRLLSQLSGGESQALKLAASLATDHAFFLLDEPSHFLDLKRKETLNLFLQNLLKEGKSLLIVEHDLNWIPKEWARLELKESDGTVRLERR